MKQKKVLVVGGGPAGMMAAIRAAQLSAKVTLIERNSSLGRKLLLTGKGRCNLTNDAPLDAFLPRLSKGAAFMRDAFKVFFQSELKQFFAQRGLLTKTERQHRVFPVTDKSTNVLQVLEKELQDRGVQVCTRQRIQDLIIENGCVAGVISELGKTFLADAVVLATGGVSYPKTGSTGDGHRMAEQVGHQRMPLRVGLAAVETEGVETKTLEGLTLKNIQLKFTAGNNKVVTSVGELVFTANGISGPLVISHCGWIADQIQAGRQVVCHLDTKPGLSVDQVVARLERECRQKSRFQMKTLIAGWLPKSFGMYVLKKGKIPEDLQANQLKGPQRQQMVNLLKGFPMVIQRTKGFGDAMVTRGGVSLKEIDPKTMASKKIKGLFFAGELIDIDGDTGGFNLQVAFSSGYLAGESAGYT